MERVPTRLTPAALNSLPYDVATIFDEVQSTTRNHAKNRTHLLKLHDDALETYEELSWNRHKAVGKHKFQEAFMLGLFKTLRLPKGNSRADNVAIFAGSYLAATHNREANEQQSNWAVQFTNKILKELKGGYDAKDRNVRYRILYIMSKLSPNLGEIEYETYESLRTRYVQRLSDKDKDVRAMAAYCLANFCGSETEEQVHDGEPLAQDILLETLSMDPSSEVRKVILSQIPLNSDTIPHIIAQARHKDVVIRKLVYAQVLRKGIWVEDNEPGPCHPTEMSLENMESIIRKGLRDSSDGPRQAAVSLVNEWVKAFERAYAKPEPGFLAEVGLISLLELFDVYELKPEELEPLELMLKTILSSRPDIMNSINFGDDFWNQLGPENAMIARVYVEYCQEQKESSLSLQNKLDEILPEVVVMAQKLEGHYSALQSLYEAQHEDTKVDPKNIRKREFILAEMFKFAALLDYTGDHVGIGHMQPLIRDILTENQLPTELLPLCLDVLRELADEKDFIRQVVEIVDTLRESVPVEGYQASCPFQTVFDPCRLTCLQPHTSQQEDIDEMDARCLQMCIHMLERVNSSFENNSTLAGVTQALIVPRLSHPRPDISKYAVTCVGLTSLIAKRTASHSLHACIRSIKSPETLPDMKVVVYKVLFDLLMAYRKRLFDFTPRLVPLEEIEELLLDQLGKEEDFVALTVLCEGLMKLILTDFMDTPHEFIVNLFKMFTWPQTQDQPALLQRLNYFFHAYPHSSAKHQGTMQMIFIDAVKEVAKTRADLIGDESVITSVKVCDMFIEWTDPTKLEAYLESKGGNTTTVNHSVQIDLAEQILKSLFEKTNEDKLAKDDKRALYQLLARLVLPDEVDVIQVTALQLLIDNLKRARPSATLPQMGPSKTAFKKFETGFLGRYAAQIEAMSEEDYRKYEGLDDLFKFLEDVFPDDSDAEDVKPKLRGQKRWVSASLRVFSPISDGWLLCRRSRSAAPGSGEEEEEISARNKRPR
ncbi:hypothetical protein FA13DRAFT_1626049 [Coprinellus micaceus]|uniref:Nuclear condensin complex subunit 3 C-terminal domain-containing protein n=1 Tax=Coprinellus micaceus TaxID=71717 RepID=A0A4Y7TJ50_COPMI|nr:hypothetical protein FA13DRAFT_1626049 [Coprinellus micaceus]